MIGEYARLTSAELDRAVQDPHWAREFIDELIDSAQDEETSAAPPRCLDIDKAWDTLRFLLRRIDFPIDIVHGEVAIPGAEDWGYGPPRYLTPEQVRTASAALAATPGDVLIRGVTTEQLAQADLYPGVTDDDEEWLSYVVGHFEVLVPFFQAAAGADDAIVVWLD